MKKLLILSVLFCSFLMLKAQSFNIGTYAGNGYNPSGFGGFSGDGGQATSAELGNPQGVAYDTKGNVYIADEANNRIRKINSSGIISTFAGSNVITGYSGDGGPASSAEIALTSGQNSGIVVDNAGNVYFADESNNVIRIVNTSGTINTMAGNFNDGPGFSGDGGQATAAELNYPIGLALDASGNLYIAEGYNDDIRKVTTSGIISTVAGNAAFGPGYSGDGGQATSAELKFPCAVALDASGNLYISDSYNSLIRKVTKSSGIISDFAGNYALGSGYTGDGGAATSAQMQNPDGVSIDGSGNLYICDPGNQVIRQVNTSGVINSLIGDSHQGFFGDGGPATSAELWNPEDVSVIPGGNEVFVADNENNRIRSAVVCNLTITPVVIQNVLCNGEKNGNAQANISGSFSPIEYTYSWSNGSSTVSTVNPTGAILSAGTYTVTVVDYYGCTNSASVIITQPLILAANASITSNVLCNGESNAIINSAPSGGTTPYTYSWSGGGGTNATVSGLSTGTFTVTVTDAHGCTGTGTVNITQPPVLNANATTTTNVSCNAGNNGSATSAPSGGTSPYTYSWSGGHGSGTAATSLSVGTYTISVTDKNGCTATGAVTITQPLAALASNATITANVNCNGGNNASSESAPSGGTAPYTYSWSGGHGSSSAATALTAGSYTVTVTDNHGCTSTQSVTITQPLTLSITRDSAKDISGCDGKAWVKSTGGTSPYTYSWSPGGESTDSISNQCAGTYCCTVTDNNGCTESVCIKVTTPTGINNIGVASDGIVIYPNPSSGLFTVELAVNSEQFAVEVYNDIGEKVYSQSNIQNPTFNINLSAQSNGIYLVRILTKDGTLVSQKKVVKMN